MGKKHRQQVGKAQDGAHNKPSKPLKRTGEVGVLRVIHHLIYSYYGIKNTKSEESVRLREDER